MRRAFVSVLLVAIAIAAVAATASARNAKTTTTTLRVVEIRKSSQQTRRSFITRGVLVQPGDRNDVVGHDVVKFTPRKHHGRHNQLGVKGVAHFRDRGSLKVQGGAGPGDNRLPIIGGTGDFNGAAGKLKTHNLGKRKTLLTFIFVQ